MTFLDQPARILIEDGDKKTSLRVVHSGSTYLDKSLAFASVVVDFLMDLMKKNPRDEYTDVIINGSVTGGILVIVKMELAE